MASPNKFIDNIKVAAFPLLLGVVMYYGSKMVSTVEDIQERVIRIEERQANDHSEIERLRNRESSTNNGPKEIYSKQAAILPEKLYIKEK